VEQLRNDDEVVAKKKNKQLDVIQVYSFIHPDKMRVGVWGE